jgi:hypothetical protein
MFVYEDLKTLFDAQATAAESTTLDVSRYEFIELVVASANSANLTLKFQGALADAEPDFSATAELDNEWDYVGAYNTNSGDFIAGDDGVVFSGTDSVELIKINVDWLKWFSCSVTARSAGDVTVRVRGLRKQ